MVIGKQSAAATIVAALFVFGLLKAPAMRAQNGRIAFEVASIKPATGAVSPSTVALDPWDDDSVSNGRFRADATLLTYIEFAYKLWPSGPQDREFSRLPKWVDSDRYLIDARAATRNTTEDQLRLMVQSLLAGRFGLASHFEAREVPVLELRLARAGQTGPKLVRHADGPPCDKPGSSLGTGLPGFPGECHSLGAADIGNIVVGSRDVPLDVLAGALSILPSLELGRPVVDKTGLQGRFDFTLEFAREPRPAAAGDSPLPAAPTGPTPIEALRDQLGLKLEPARDALQILVIDKVGKPSEN